MDEGLAVASRKAKPAGDKAFDPNGPIDASRALVPAVQRVNEQRVKRGFWPKVRRTATRIPFSRELLSAWFCARDPETPAAAKGMLLGALAYFVLPTDAIPDILAGVGFNANVDGLYRVTLDVNGMSGGPQSFSVDAQLGAGVPEPATWAMMIGGFGLVGGAMRRRTRTSVTFA